MSDMQSVRDDIAFMRALAEEGRSAPLIGGSMMVAAGLIFGAASLGGYVIQMKWFNLSPWLHLPLWFGAAVVFAAVGVALRGRLRSRPGAGSPNNRALQSAWRGIGFAIGVLWLAMMVASWRLESYIMFAMFPSMILALYGAAWTVAAKMSGRPWMNGIATLSFASAISIAFLLDRPELYLAYAAALGLTAVLPGVLLMRQEPSDIV